MNKYKRKGFLLHAKGKEYKSKVKYSLQIIREAFEGNSCYVSFSGTSKFHPYNHYYEDQFIILRELLRMNLKEDWDKEYWND